MKQPSQFRKNELSISILFALSVALPGAAFATGLPGAGTVTVGNVEVNAGHAAKTGGSTGSIITGLNAAPTLTVAGNSVVQWGGPTHATSVTEEAMAPNSNAPGFNIGGGQTLTIVGTMPGLSLLNVDASGNPSVIAGTLNASGKNGVNIFIANANGVTVAPTGVISAPVVGFIGANLASTTLIDNIVQANTAQTNFAVGNPVDIGYAAGGNINVLGTINDNTATTAAATDIVLAAGSTSVNVAGTLNTTALNIYGGVGGTVTNAGLYVPDMGTPE
jgi:filamentous hemagglutinin family protein